MSFAESMLELGLALRDVWDEAASNHHEHSDMGDREGNIRFLALGMCGEAGECANFIKKRWRDGDLHEDAIKAEIADTCAYAFMLAQEMDMTAQELIDLIAHKQKVFRDKMGARPQ